MRTIDVISFMSVSSSFASACAVAPLSHCSRSKTRALPTDSVWWLRCTSACRTYIVCTAAPTAVRAHLCPAVHELLHVLRHGRVFGESRLEDQLGHPRRGLMEDLGRHALIAENRPFACILVCLCARTTACERAPMRTTVRIHARAQTHETHLHIQAYP